MNWRATEWSRSSWTVSGLPPSPRRYPARSCRSRCAARRLPRAPATPSRRQSCCPWLMRGATECCRCSVAHRAPRRACYPAPGRYPRDRGVPPNARRWRGLRGAPTPRPRPWQPAARRWLAGCALHCGAPQRGAPALPAGNVVNLRRRVWVAPGVRPRDEGLPHSAPARAARSSFTRVAKAGTWVTVKSSV